MTEQKKYSEAYLRTVRKLTCVNHPDRIATETAAHIPVCAECAGGYHTEAKAGGARPFYAGLLAKDESCMCPADGIYALCPIHRKNNSPR